MRDQAFTWLPNLTITYGSLLLKSLITRPFPLTTVTFNCPNGSPMSLNSQGISAEAEIKKGPKMEGKISIKQDCTGVRQQRNMFESCRHTRICRKMTEEIYQIKLQLGYPERK